MFVSVTLPLARPAIAAGATLMVMETLADFGAVSYFSVPTFTTGIFRTWQAFGDLAGAYRMAALLLFTIRPLLLRTLHRSSALQPTNVDAIRGLGGRLTAPFAGDIAEARLDNGELWSVIRSPAADTLAVGDRVVVTAVRGARVEIAPELSSATAPAAADPILPTDRSADR